MPDINDLILKELLRMKKELRELKKQVDGIREVNNLWDGS